MRRYLALGAICVGAVACTSLLGTFQVSQTEVTPGSDGGNDAGPDAAVDATSGIEAGSDGAGPSLDATSLDSASLDASDAGSTPSDAAYVDSPSGADSATNDAGASLRRLQCSAPTSSRVQVTMGDSLHADLVGVAPVIGNNDDVRVALVDYVPSGTNYTAVLRGYTVNVGDSTQTTSTSLATNAGQVFLLQRYTGTQSGFVAVFEDYEMMGNALEVARLPDGATSWLTPISIATVDSTLNNVNVTLESIDASQDSYYVAMTAVDGTTETLYGAAVSGASTASLPVLTTFTLNPPATDGFELPSPGIATKASQQAYLLLSPNGDNGPPALGAPMEMYAPGQVPSSATITPPSTLNYLGYGMVNATLPGVTNLAVLQADLNQIQLTYRVGQVGTDSLLSVDPMNLAGTSAMAADGGTATFTDFIISNQSVKWEYAGIGDQLLMMAARTDLNTTYSGLNFGWWDASGVLRSYTAGDSALLTDVPYVRRADATFATLVGSIAQLWLAYENAATAPGNSNYPPPASDLWIAKIGCAP